MAVAKHVIAVVDRNHDGVISTKEVTAYSELLKRDLIVRLDQRRVALKLTASNFPAPAELRTGWAVIQMQFSLVLGPLAAGPHRLSLDNRHLSNMSVYLLNAAQPRSDSVQITRQTRNKNQSAGEIEFSIE